MPFKVPELALCWKKKVWIIHFTIPQRMIHINYSLMSWGEKSNFWGYTYRAYAFCSSCLLSSSSFPSNKRKFQPKTGSVLKIYVLSLNLKVFPYGSEGISNGRNPWLGYQVSLQMPLSPESTWVKVNSFASVDISDVQLSHNNIALTLIPIFWDPDMEATAVLFGRRWK